MPRSELEGGESTEFDEEKAFTGKKKPIPKQRKVIYTSSLRIQVKNVKNAIAEVRAINNTYQGFIEKLQTSNSYKQAVMVLRVPVASFDRAVEDLQKIGRVDAKTITADDITDKFTDAELRLQSLQLVRKRLYALLSRAKKPEEKVKILKEIARLTTDIEELTSQLEYYKNKSSFSTITLTLSAYQRQVAVKYLPSPFPWIQELSIEKRSSRYTRLLFDVFAIKKPKGYFDKLSSYKKRNSNFIFTTPGYSSGVRIGYVKNYPNANLAFWLQAVQLEAKKRFYKRIGKSTIRGKHKFQVLVFQTSDDTIYVLGIQVFGKHIVLCEGFFKDSKTYKAYRKTYDRWIKNVEYRQWLNF